MADVSRYVVWRRQDLAAFGSTSPTGRPYGSLGDGARAIADRRWHEGVCSICGKAVWFQPQNLAGHRMVCWPCANLEDAVA